jgi:hypothetical protein
MFLWMLLVLALSCPCFFVTVSLSACSSRIICPGLYNAGQVRLSTTKHLCCDLVNLMVCIALREEMRVRNILLSYNMKLLKYKYLMLILLLAPSSQMPLVCVLPLGKVVAFHHYKGVVKIIVPCVFTFLNSRGDNK